MPSHPSESGPRPPGDFGRLLATKEPVLLVGGQAVNLWALYYRDRTADLAPFVSRDVEVLGNREPRHGPSAPPRKVRQIARNGIGHNLRHHVKRFARSVSQRAQQIREEQAE